MRILPSFEFRDLAAVLALVACVTCVGSGQTSYQSLPNGYLNADANTGTMFPFSTPATQKWHWVYDSGQFAVQNPISITELAIRAGVATATWPGGSYNIEISMGSSVNNYATSTGYSTTFASNFASPPVVVFNGTWTVPAGGNPANPNPTAAWENLVLQTPFNYNASLGQDLIVQIRTIGPNTAFGISLDCKSTPTGGNGGAAMGNLTSATAVTATFIYNELVPVIRIGYTALQALWQVNQANASIDIDGLAPQPPVNPIMKCVNAVNFLHLSSPLGTPWDLAVGFAPPVPLGGGALALIDGQVVNMSLADPTLILLNGLFAGGPFPAGTLTIPFAIPVPLSITMQFAVADPSTSSGARLSQALRLQTVLPSGPISYTMTDDSFVFVNFSGAPFCGPPSFTFFGVPYTSLYLASNGFVCFGAGNQTYAATSSASFLGGPPRVAPLWTDLDPPTGGTITVSVTPTTVVCDWITVAQFGQTAAVNRTFRLTLDSVTGNLTFDNYAIVGGNASSGCGIGITPGNPIATDPGPVIFLNELGVGVLPGPANATDITYEISTNTIVNLGAISSITFMPNSSGNYDRLTL